MCLNPSMRNIVSGKLETTWYPQPFYIIAETYVINGNHAITVSQVELKGKK